MSDHAETAVLLEEAAGDLRLKVPDVPDGSCQPEAVAALEESAAILEDAAQVCRETPAREEAQAL